PSEGFDCSGFVRYVFGQHGMSLPGGVRDLYVHGRGIPRSALRAGDLVFFRTITTGASHVAIALGTEEFIHAPSGRGEVRVDSLRSPYWSNRYIGARRVL
ncbi:MAG: C40 family peptidase, partial [Acidimicrobiia bacterium]